MFRATSIIFLLFSSLFLSARLSAQPGWTMDPFGQEQKPEQYQEKKLASEKTADKKFTFLRHFTHNTTTHYNYYFNANNKLKMIMEQARASHQDDLTKLLSFYPYSLDNTASQQVELDSIIYKATAGILLHDLRNDWVDDMYMLIGKAYFFRKQFDSAEMTFQFINYNMFPRKKGEDDNRVVGSNLSNSEPGSMFSIADKENSNIIKKTFSVPPSRNDALVWLGKTFTEAGLYSDAASMINILYQDPNLPGRLRGDLDELNAYWYYKQEMYDSCAPYLEKALDNAPTKQDRSRWEYLLGQLYAMFGNFERASGYYMDAAKHTVDPMIDIYSNLNDAKMRTGSGDNTQLESNIARLLKMGRQDKYNAYRDIIYFSAADLTLRKPDTATALQLFQKSLKYNENNTPYKNKAFLKVADIAYDFRDYKEAASYYDSVDINDPTFSKEDTAYIAARKEVLDRVAELITIIEKEDSLQVLAKLSPAELDAAVKKLVKKQKKEGGGKKGEDEDTGANIDFAGQKDQKPVDLFSSSSKGDWYFYNASVRTRGFNEFTNKWGKRGNLDNWRRKNSVDAALKNMAANLDIDAPPAGDSSNAADASGLVPGSYDALMADVPLSPEKLDSSRERLARAYLELSLIFQNELMDYPEAIYEYDQYLSRFDRHPGVPEALMGLYFCYMKLGQPAEAEKYKRMLSQGYSGTDYAKKVNDPKSMLSPAKSESKESARYEQIYNLFIEGKFSEALAAKQKANEEIGTGYWTPQLLYVEAVYYVKERNDSAAIRVLDDIINLFPESPMRAKAETMKDVVSRRAEIEAYLTGLDVTRAPEEKVIVPDSRPAAVSAPKPQPKTEEAPQIKPSLPVSKPTITRDTVRVMPSVVKTNGYALKPDEPHLVIMVLDKVDGVYINEVNNAFSRLNREKSDTRGVVIKREPLDAEKTILSFEIFDNANAGIAYMDRLKKAAPSYISWLQSNKYSFLIITAENLIYLRESKDINTYRSVLNKDYPGKF